MVSDFIAGLLVVERGRHRFEPIKAQIISNTNLCLITKAIRQIWLLLADSGANTNHWRTTTPYIPSEVELVHFSFVSA
jgi:DUF2075 family protein